MHVLAISLRLGHRPDHGLAEIVRVRTHEAQPSHARDSADGAQKIREVVVAVEIRVDRLPDQDDLGDPGGDDRFGFAHDVRELATSFRPPGCRHDAIGALVIASALHRNPRLHSVESAGLEILVVLFEIEVGRGGADAAAGALDQRRQIAVAVGTNHETHVPGTIEELRPESLRHAARDAEHGVALHPALHLADPADHALLGVFADRAGVDEDHIRSVRLLDGFIAGFHQLTEHELGVADVHLATVRLYVDRWAGSLEHARKISFAPTIALRRHRADPVPLAAPCCAPGGWLSIATGSDGSSI